MGLSIFRPGPDASAEYNAMIEPEPAGGFAGQWAQVLAAVGELADKAVPVFMRVFLSDAVNQTPLPGVLPDCAVSVVGQAPMTPGVKVSAWVYLREDVSVRCLPGGLYEVALADGVKEYWQAGLSCPGSDSEAATSVMLADYAGLLRSRGLSLEANCLRTWFFVRDVDTTYAGMVRARNAVFTAEGLLPTTHFIASTGIGAQSTAPCVAVALDTYAVDGLGDGCVTYLKAASHLNPTSEYGVAFERATAIDFPDRRHVLVSGTASIDNCGRIVHPGDIRRQAARMCDNVEALLAESGCRSTDMTHAIVYIRDTADAGVVSGIIAGRYPGVPFVVVLGPVCRPGWLVEMECMAARAVAHS